MKQQRSRIGTDCCRAGNPVSTKPRGQSVHPEVTLRKNESARDSLSHGTLVELSRGTPLGTDCDRTQQHPQVFPRMASRPSQTMSGRTAKAAIGSAHFTCQSALIASPAKAMSER